jgi:hypothetical protein
MSKTPRHPPPLPWPMHAKGKLLLSLFRSVINTPVGTNNDDLIECKETDILSLDQLASAAVMARTMHHCRGGHYYINTTYYRGEISGYEDDISSASRRRF